MTRDRDMGTDLEPKALDAAFWARRCPRCAAPAYGTDSKWWNAYGIECLWWGDDVRGGFKCRKESRDGPNAS